MSLRNVKKVTPLVEQNMTQCFVFGTAHRLVVKSVDPENPDDPARTGPLYAEHGELKGYLDGEECSGGARRTGGNGNPDPCYILVKSSIVGSVNLQAAAGYLLAQADTPDSGVVVKDSLDQDFPPPWSP